MDIEIKKIQTEAKTPDRAGRNIPRIAIFTAIGVGVITWVIIILYTPAPSRVPKKNSAMSISRLPAHLYGQTSFTTFPPFIRGTITDKGRGFLKVTVFQSAPIINVNVPNSAKISEQKLKQAPEIERLTGEYVVKKAKNPETEIVFPKIYDSERRISFADLHIGDAVLVYIAGGNIRQAVVTASNVARIIKPE